MMKIKIKCFSQLKYALETDELILELESGITTDALQNVIREKANGKLDGISLRVAVNKKYVKANTNLKDGDEVVFIPPVQGG